MILDWLRQLWCGLRRGHSFVRAGSDYLRCVYCGRIRDWPETGDPK